MSEVCSGIIGWLKNSFIDFPGTVSTVLFFRGCNLRCPYCHNPSIIRGEGLEIPLQSVLDHLRKRGALIDGVVLSGGEPTLHRSIIDIRKTFGEMGLRVKLDTNGLLPDTVAACSPDYLALDVKTVPRRYGSLGGPDSPLAAQALSESLSIVKSMGARAEVRLTVAPSFIDEDIIGELAEMLDGVERVYLQRMRCETEVLDRGFCAGAPVVTLERLIEFREIISGRVGACMIRGLD